MKSDNRIETAATLGGSRCNVFFFSEMHIVFFGYFVLIHLLCREKKRKKVALPVEKIAGEAKKGQKKKE